MEKLTQKRSDDKKEQKAKDKIIEQYLQQTKQDHALELNNMHEYIAELQEGKASSNGATVALEQVASIRSENTELKLRVS